MQQKCCNTEGERVLHENTVQNSIHELFLQDEEFVRWCKLVPIYGDGGYKETTDDYSRDTLLHVGKCFYTEYIITVKVYH